MRIISGVHKGRKINAPKGLPVRPTTDFAKEGLFNILRNKVYFDELTVLELYAGTGNISYEFASRGTPQIWAVDAHAGCIRFIQKTASELDLPIEAIKSDVKKFIISQNKSFDIVFADPPYNLSLNDLEDLVTTILENDLIKPEGYLILEHTKQLDFSLLDCFIEKRKYSNSVFSFFKPNKPKIDSTKIPHSPT